MAAESSRLARPAISVANAKPMAGSTSAPSIACCSWPSRENSSACCSSRANVTAPTALPAAPAEPGRRKRSAPLRWPLASAARLLASSCAWSSRCSATVGASASGFLRLTVISPSTDFISAKASRRIAVRDATTHRRCHRWSFVAASLRSSVAAVSLSTSFLRKVRSKSRPPFGPNWSHGIAASTTASVFGTRCTTQPRLVRSNDACRRTLVDRHTVSQICLKREGNRGGRSRSLRLERRHLGHALRRQLDRERRLVQRLNHAPLRQHSHDIGVEPRRGK